MSSFYEQYINVTIALQTTETCHQTRSFQVPVAAIRPVGDVFASGHLVGDVTHVLYCLCCKFKHFFLGWVLMLPGYAWDSTIILMTVKTSLKRSNLRFFPADFHLGGGGLGVTQYDPLKFPNMAIFCEWGARFLG